VLSQWHRPSFATCIDVGKSYDLEITELDYRLNPGIAYTTNRSRFVLRPQRRAPHHPLMAEEPKGSRRSLR
jgi:hypothetical protein